MSALNRIKGILLNELKSTHPEVRKAMLRVFNSIDGDLDALGYDPSSDVDEAYANIYKVLSEIDYDHDEPVQEAEKEIKKLKQIDRSQDDEEE